MGVRIAMFGVFSLNSDQNCNVIIVQKILNGMGFLFGWCFVERAD